MRTIEIGSEIGEEFPFLAIDRATGQVMFRHNNRDELEMLCLKLRWNVVKSLPVCVLPEFANCGAEPRGVAGSE